MEKYKSLVFRELKLGTILMLLFNAVEIPFTIRFGEKRGSLIKTIIGIGIVIIALIAFFINPAGISDMVNDFLFNGKIPSLMKWILPVGAVISYIIFCAVSCKLYIKGVINSYKYEIYCSGNLCNNCGCNTGIAYR